MNLIHITVTEADFPFLMEAISLRSMSLQEELRRQLVSQRLEKERQAKIESITPAQTVHADATSTVTVTIPSEDKSSLNERPLRERRAALKKLLSTKEGRALPIAEIARRAGVSYVTARKAVVSKRKN